jgi:large subunit ribosomal protein L29
MKTEELTTLDAEELEGKLKDARRELYELRFKLAVGQLDNHRQIRQVRKDIARILTVVHQRRWEGWEAEDDVGARRASPAAEETPGAGDAAVEAVEAESVDSPEEVEGGASLAPTGAVEVADEGEARLAPTGADEGEASAAPAEAEAPAKSRSKGRVRKAKTEDDDD